MTTTGAVEVSPATRVLAFAADDGFLCVDISRVEGMLTRSEVRMHTLKTGDATSRRFLIHRGEPALVVDVREALGLGELLGVTDRAAFIVMRAGSFPLALAVDACTGIRDLDLQAQVPMPTALQHDGGFSVGHLLELDGTIHTLLEPSRLLSSALRERLDPFLVEARGFSERERALAALAQKLRGNAGTLTDLKTYARIARRNGRTRAAVAARTVLKIAQEVERGPHDSAPIVGDLGANTLLRDLLVLSAGRQTGELQLGPQSSDTSVLLFLAGRIVDARAGGLLGRAAVKQLLTLHDGPYRFRTVDVPAYPQRIDDSTLWLLVETLTESETRRSRQSR